MCFSRRRFGAAIGSFRNQHRCPLAALDASEVDSLLSYLRVLISTQSGCYVFSINNSAWTLVSAHAAKVLDPFDGMEKVDHATLRKALLAAK
jgi:hypothetical protein